MKKLSFFIIALSISLCSFSQVIVNITSVPCNTGLEGLYPFEYAGESGGYSDWGCPNMQIPSNSVAGSLEFVNDSTSGMVTGVGSPPLVGVPKGYLGCDTLGNPTQDLAGKIAVIYRGTCEFGYKALNAQQRGAIGVIIINHTGDPITMGGGTYGVRVTIPVVMISRDAGDDLRIAIECMPNSVTGFIGSKVGVFANDMGSSMGDILMPNELALPLSLANYYNRMIDLGFWIYNFGSNSQTGINASVTVQRGTTLLYNQTSVPLNFASPDSSNPLNIVLDTQFIDLGIFSPATWNLGVYTVTYTIDNANDEDLSDNTFTFNFNITSLGVYAKSRVDAYNQPIHNTSLSLNETTIQYDDWETCIVFKDAFNFNFIFQGMTFSATPVNGLMTNEIIEIRAYHWNDIFNNITDTLTFNSLVQVSNGFYQFAGTPDSLDNIYAPFDTPIALDNNKRYLFCVYNASNELKIGFDYGINYKSTVNHYQQPIAPLKILPNGNAPIWDWKGFGFDKTPSISLIIDDHIDSFPCNFPPFPCVGIEEEVNENATIPYPNPTTNFLTIPIRSGVLGNVKIEVFDLAGKLVLSENKTISNEPLKLNVASIKNGAYLFNLTLANGTKEVFKISVNR